MDPDEEPRFEVEVPPPRVPPKQVGLQIVLVLLGVLGVIRSPFMLGAGLVLPMTFLALGVVVSRRRLSTVTVRFFDTAIEVSSEGTRRRTAWRLVERVIETSAGAAVHFSFGRPVWIPRERLPTDRRLFLDAIPKEIAIVAGEEPKKKERGPTFWFLLWLFLVGLFVALWNLVVER